MPDFVDEILDTFLLCIVSSGFFTRPISAVPDISICTVNPSRERERLKALPYMPNLDFVDEILDTFLLRIVSSGFFTRRISAIPDI